MLFIVFGSFCLHSVFSCQFNEFEDQNTRDSAIAFQRSQYISKMRSISFFIASLTSYRWFAACPTQRRTEFMDMNTDCQLLIFGNLNFATLFPLSETNKYLSSLAREVLKRRFAEKTLIISMSYYFGRTEYNVNETDNRMSTHINVMLLRCISTLLIYKSALRKMFGLKHTVRRTHWQQRTNDVWQMQLKRHMC